MEYLARVHDGSEDGLGTGYWLLQIIGAESGKDMVLPLYNRLYSQRSPDHQSENIEILTAIETVSRATQGKGVWVMDRGGENKEVTARESQSFFSSVPAPSEDGLFRGIPLILLKG